MSEPDFDPARTDLEGLQALRADASELERLEGLRDRFKVLTAIGFDKDEVMHSDFLASLLDPRRTGVLATQSGGWIWSERR